MESDCARSSWLPSIEPLDEGDVYAELETLDQSPLSDLGMLLSADDVSVQMPLASAMKKSSSPFWLTLE